jgi:hypothetical protein
VARSLLVSFSIGMQIALTVFNVALGLVALAAMARTLRWKGLVAPAREEVEHVQVEQAGVERAGVERAEPSG